MSVVAWIFLGSFSALVSLFLVYETFHRQRRSPTLAAAQDLARARGAGSASAANG